MTALRIGILGAARITPEALIAPAHDLGHRLVTVAARDRQRANIFAASHGIERLLSGYQNVIDDPEVDVVYNPLPNGLHGPWNIRALEAGKHVLSEKPSASNADEAQAVLEATTTSPGRFMEAFHYRYHPVMQRLLEIAGNEDIGTIEHVEVEMGFGLTNLSDPRWDFDLAGGATMDVGCYALHGIRSIGTVLGGEPAVVSAQAIPHEPDPRVDAELSGDLVYPSGATAHFRASFVRPERSFTLHLRGTRGEAWAHDFVLPHLDNRITVVTPTQRKVDSVGNRPTYHYQLEAFAAALANNTPIVTDATDALAQSHLIDSCYLAAGLPLRPVSTIGD